MDSSDYSAAHEHNRRAWNARVQRGQRFTRDQRRIRILKIRWQRLMGWDGSVVIFVEKNCYAWLPAVVVRVSCMLLREQM